MKSNIFILCFIFLGTCVVSVDAGEQERRVEEANRQDADAARSHTVKTGAFFLDYGGWINFRYNRFTDEDNDKSSRDLLRTSTQLDARTWLKFTRVMDPEQGQEHTFYLRFKDRYVTRTGQAPGARYDNDGPHVDHAYGILDLRPVWIEAGRRYFNVGRGIAYSDINDGIQINYRKPGFNAGLFAAKNLPHQSNIDTSVPGYDKHNERYFYGLGLGYTGIPRQSLYGFVLAQNDFSDEGPNDSSRNYTYNSQYFGLGSKGGFLKSWSYWSEIILQTGSSRVYTTDERKDVRAFAFDTEVVYAPDMSGRPRLSLEYALGSGDKDRQSVTDTQFGNTSGADRNFLYFGYAPTGYALAPRLSNLQMLRAGFEFAPFERVSAFKHLTLGIDIYSFYKHRSGGGISDLEATEDAMDVGREVDLTLKWRVLSDVTVSLEYGRFMPGDAYAPSANSSQDFLSIGITHTF